MSDEQVLDDARRELEQSIQKYYDTVEPGVYVESFVLVSHKRRSDLEINGQSVVGYQIKRDQDWVTTCGLLEVAHRADMNSMREND